MLTRRTLVAVAALALCGSVATFSSLRAEEKPESGGDVVAELLRERRDVLRERLEMFKVSLENGDTQIDATAVLTAENVVLDAEIELARDPSERIARHEAKVSNLQRVEELLHKQRRSGEATQADLLAAKAGRLQAQIDLERARGE